MKPKPALMDRMETAKTIRSWASAEFCEAIRFIRESPARSRALFVPINFSEFHFKHQQFCWRFWPANGVSPRSIA
jgi:hypothetical protein